MIDILHERFLEKLARLSLESRTGNDEKGLNSREDGGRYARGSRREETGSSWSDI